jgi:hypothetical protein
MAGASDAATPTCSYCGSLEPGRFLDLIEAGWIVEPTDKNYKAYLKRPLTETEVADRKQAWLQRDGAALAVRRVERVSGKTDEEVDAELDKRWDVERAIWAGGDTEAKVYFMHLSIGQRMRFIELYNARAMAISHPGHFYVRPYFVAPRG